MKFKYIASEPSGKIVEGNIEMVGPSEVLEWMVGQGLRPVSVKAIGGVEGTKLRALFSPAISFEDKVFLTKYLSLMLKVGTDLFKAIDVLIVDFDKPAVKAFLIEVKDALAKGQPFYSTFTRYPKYFSSVFVNLVKAGEQSGSLDKVFDDLSRGLEKEQRLRSKLKGALIYPVILVCLAFIIVFLLTAFALPKLADVFTSGGIQPPLFSRIVFGIGKFLGDNVFVIITLMVGGVVGGFVFFKNTIVGRKMGSRFISRLPIISQVIYRTAVQRFASTLSSLLKAGMPLIESIESTADAVGHPEMKAALLRISREGVSKGLTLGEAFQREPFFPRVVVNLIAVSEKVGHIEDILEKLADFYEAEIDTSVKTLVSFLEPALLVIIGLLVGVIALAIIVPIYQLTGSVG